LLLISVLDRGEWSYLGHCYFVTEGTAPGTHLMGGWEDLRVGLDAVAKRKVHGHPGNQTPDIQPIARSLYGDITRILCKL
jgi:hypothetical protein